jgi:hypothetical protein
MSQRAAWACIRFLAASGRTPQRFGTLKALAGSALAAPGASEMVWGACLDLTFWVSACFGPASIHSKYTIWGGRGPHRDRSPALAFRADLRSSGPKEDRQKSFRPDMCPGVDLSPAECASQPRRRARISHPVCEALESQIVDIVCPRGASNPSSRCSVTILIPGRLPALP